MKVLHFITSIDKTSGGMTTFLELLTTQIRKQVEIVVATGFSRNPIDLMCTKVQFFNLSLKRWLKLSKEFANFINLEDPDIVHINGIWTPQNWLFQRAAQHFNIKVLLSPHGMLEPYILNRHFFKKKIALVLYQNQALKKANYIHVTAQSELNQIRLLGLTQPSAIIANGIDITKVKTKNIWKDGIKNILFLSRVHPKKGIEFLIEAISKVNQENLHINIAGEGNPKYIEFLKQLVFQKQVSAQFSFIGGVYGEKKWKLYQNADLFVLPTYSENFGIVIAEALASKIPVITTKGTPWQELESQKCGWWIDLNLPSLIDSLNEALNTESVELMEMGNRGRKLIESNYDIKRVTKKMENLYYWILEGGSQPGFIDELK